MCVCVRACVRVYAPVCLPACLPVVVVLRSCPRSPWPLSAVTCVSGAVAVDARRQQHGSCGQHHDGPASPAGPAQSFLLAGQSFVGPQRRRAPACEKSRGQTSPRGRRGRRDRWRPLRFALQKQTNPGSPSPRPRSRQVIFCSFRSTSVFPAAYWHRRRACLLFLAPARRKLPSRVFLPRAHIFLVSLPASHYPLALILASCPRPAC